MKIQIMNHSHGVEHPDIELATFLKNNDQFVQSLRIIFSKEDDGFSKIINIDDFGVITEK